MRLHPRSVSMAFGLVILAVTPAAATVLPTLDTPVASAVDSAPVNKPPAVMVNDVALPEAVISPSPISMTAITSPEPADNVYDFVSNPEISAPQFVVPEAVTPSIYQASIYQVAPYAVPAIQPVSMSPVPILYTGPSDAPSGPGGAPLLLTMAAASEAPANLFTKVDPPMPDITSAFNNSTVRLGPAFVTPEPRWVSLMAVAAVLALGIVAAQRRRKELVKELVPSPQPES